MPAVWTGIISKEKWFIVVSAVDLLTAPA